MSQFLERYVRYPLDALLSHAPAQMPDLLLVHDGATVTYRVGDESLVINRTEDPALASDEHELPVDWSEDED